VLARREQEILCDVAGNDRIRKYLDAGTELGQVTRARAEELVRELVNAGDIQRDQAQEWVDNLVERSRKTSEQFLDLVRHEVATQLKKIDTPALEALAGQVADLLKRSATAGRTATADFAAQATKGATKGATTARSAAKKATATAKTGQATATKKTAPKKAPAKKAATKKAAAKKAPPPRPSGSST
jgi:polyhydroxyalkanoate synthesis regulator phasin